MAPMSVREDWRFALTEPGVQSAMNNLDALMLQLYANRWASLKTVCIIKLCAC